MGHGKTRVLVQAGVVNALANVVLNLAFIPRAGLGWGVAGAAAATMLSNLAAYATLRSHARKEFGTPWVGASTWRVCAAAAAVGLLWWQALHRLPGTFDRVWELGLWGLVGLAGYLALLAILGGLGRKDLGLLRRAGHPKALWLELRGR